MTKEELLIRAIKRLIDYVQYYRLVADVLQHKAKYESEIREKDALRHKLASGCDMEPTMEDVGLIMMDSLSLLSMDYFDIQRIYGFEPKSFKKAYWEFVIDDCRRNDPEMFSRTFGRAKMRKHLEREMRNFPQIRRAIKEETD